MGSSRERHSTQVPAQMQAQVPDQEVLVQVLEEIPAQVPAKVPAKIPAIVEDLTQKNFPATRRRWDEAPAVGWVPGRMKRGILVF